MPPSYQPLGVSIPLNLLAQDFNTPQPPDFQDQLDAQDKQRALQLAADLANQQSQIGLAEKQRKEDSAKAVSDAIKANYAGVDPNTINPDDVIKRAIALTAKQGDTGSMTDLYKAQNQSQSGGNRLLSIEEAQNLGLPAGTTLAEARIHMANNREAGTQKRFDTGMGYKQNRDQAPGFFEALPNSDGSSKVITPKMQDNLIGVQNGLDTIVRNGDALVQHLQDDRISIGDKLLIQKQEIANMLPALRQLDNQGVRFNEFLKGIDISQVGDDAELADRIAGTFTGQDPATAVARFIHEVVKQSQIRANANNSSISQSKLASFDPDSVPLFEKYGAFSRGQAKAQSGNDSMKIPVVGGGTDGGLTAEQAVKKEQWKQQKLKELAAQAGQGGL